MSFWQEHAQAEAALEKARVEEHYARYQQDAPSRCATCGTVSADVLLGICGPCYAHWREVVKD